MITYIENDGDYIEVVAEGVINVDDFLQMIEYISSNYQTEHLKILQNYSNASFNIDHSDIEQLVINTHKYLPFFTSVKTASLVCSANETAFNMLYGELINSPQFNQQSFYSRQAALSWLR